MPAGQGPKPSGRVCSHSPRQEEGMLPATHAAGADGGIVALWLQEAIRVKLQHCGFPQQAMPLCGPQNMCMSANRAHALLVADLRSIMFA